MLMLLLEAEPEELEGKGSSVVAAHLRECARCSAVASRLREETLRLTAHVAARDAHARTAVRRFARRPRPLILAGALVAAASVRRLLLVPRSTVRGPGVARPANAAQANPAPPVDSPSESAVRPAPARRMPAGTFAVSAVRFADATPATPVRFATSQSADVPEPPDETEAVSRSRRRREERRHARDEECEDHRRLALP